MEELRPNEERAKTAIVLIWIVLVLNIISIISAYMQYDMLLKIAEKEDVSNRAAELNDLRVLIIQIIFLVAFIISIITFIRWFRRAYFNLHIKADFLSYSEGWAAGCWFVPILNLFRPYYIMKELYKKTQEMLSRNGVDYKNISVRVLGWWWALWIINNIFGQIVTTYAKNADKMSELIFSSLGFMFAKFIGILVALLAIKVIYDYSKMEPLLNEIKTETDMETATYNSLHLDEGSENQEKY